MELINTLNIAGLLIRLSGVRASSASAMKAFRLMSEGFFFYVGICYIIYVGVNLTKEIK